MRRISELWLQDQRQLESQFSIPFFNEEHIANSPLAIAERKGDAAAFATVWPGAKRQELAIGMIRFLPDLPMRITEYLIVQTMMWGKENGFESFNLGLAPLADDQVPQDSRIRRELAGLTFRHAQHVYTRHGLRNFKERFEPIWQPKYLASPGRTTTKVVLKNIAELIASGSDKPGRQSD